MTMTETDFLLDIVTERLLRHRSRLINLPKSGPQEIEAYALVWRWYDYLLTYKHGAGEEKINQNWEACMAEEGLSASDALVRLVYVYAERSERLGLDLIGDDTPIKIARQRHAAWRNRKAKRQSSNG
jgi:hypothetical protein